MKIRYFFIVGAITSGLAVAISASDHIVNQQKENVFSHYTFHETYSNPLETTSETLDTSN
ncbi:Uncharacterised protein [Candidatus Bartonella washoeensis]|uniref:Uncharacterized protein n=1 Tax=Candidatus Bartonella washoeensis Sb944nv TaxID=1094563 RepID=J0QB70_9HYPH|nr:hypothetical protein [Bartonella washoeensis]EJF79989.1 hypothetical protein MCQ_00532 [Bartonella washoeensis Sb944nv]SPU26116.1 Uncharacterised protein [Bartonella washoeensis]